MHKPRFQSPSVRFLLAGYAIFCLGLRSPAAEPSPWLEIHSTHFTVITDAGEKKGKEVALRFEQMRAIFAVMLMRERLNDSEPLTILAFKNDKNYFQIAPLHQGNPIAAPGFFLPGDDQNFFVLNLFEPESWRAVTHDLAHLLLNYNYPAVPGWFDEGVAEYFSSIQLDDKNFDLGADPELHDLYTVDLLENVKEAHNPPKSLTELLGGQVWLALPDLLTMKHDTSNYLEGTHHTLYYAQSWITVHYLLHEKKLPETGTYFDLVENQHVSVEEAIQQAYGMSAAEFDQAVKIYYHSLTPIFLALDASRQQDAANHVPPSQAFHFPEIVGPNDSAISSKVLSENDARAITAEVQIRIPERREVGLQELHALATAPETPAAKPPSAIQALEKKIKRNTDKDKDDKDKDKNKDDNDDAPLLTASGNETAHRVLAWDHLQHSEFDAAAEELNDAAALNPRDMWIRYYLALLKYRIALSKHADVSGLPNMMQDLRAVLEWYPEFAEAYDMLATAQREGGGPAAAMQAERAAIQLSPRNQQYVYHLAEIYISDKKWPAAVTLLQRLKASGNPQIAAAAKARLELIPNEEKYGIASAAAAATPKFAPQPSPFDVLEQDAAQRAAAQKARTAGTADTRPAKFLQGRLVGVDCSQPPAALLTVSAGATLLKLRTADYKSLLLIGADAFSCDWTNRSISVNYKPGGISDGDLVSVELR
jgi:tetratricopeptide (TPR) repeat protein